MAFTRQQGKIDRGFSIDDDAINWNCLAGLAEYDVASAQSGGRNNCCVSIRWEPQQEMRGFRQCVLKFF
jgi:hypothetical protein